MRRVRGKMEFECESTSYMLSKEEIEKMAKDMVGKPITVYSMGDFTGERKVVGKILEAHVVDSTKEIYIDYEAELL